MTRTSTQAGDRRQYYSRYLAHYTKKNYSLLILGGLFLLGMLLGTFLLQNIQGETLDFLLRIVNGFITARQEQTLFENFASGLQSLLWLLCLFVSGFCAISQPLLLLLPLFRGLGVGLLMASMYASHGLQAIGFAAVLMLPETVLMTLAILICCRESLRLSCGFFSVLRGTEKEIYSLSVYIARYLSCALLCILAALLEAVLYAGFSGLFQL